MDDYIWLFHRESKRDFALSVAASLLLHSLMIAVMATTSIFIPWTGKTQQLDIFWLNPPFSQGGHKTAPPPASAPDKEMALTPPPLPEKKTAAEPPRPKEPSPPPAVVETSEPEPSAEAEMTYPVAKKPEKPPEKTAAEPPRQPETTPVPSPEKVEVPQQAASEQPTPASPKKTATAEPSPGAQKVEETPGAVEVARATPSPVPGTGVESATPSAGPAGLPGEGAGLPKGASVLEEQEPPRKEPEIAEPAPEPPQTKGIFAPPVSGDLKLEIIGKSELLNGIKISVNFRPYPQNRHNRPMTRSEAGRFAKLVPLHARPNENTLQAVITVAGDGIYDFRLESGAPAGVMLDFYLKIHENTGRAATRRIGARTVSNNAEIARVLMPEALLWEDDSAFSGNLESSDSISKFNTETGLIWREYK